MSVPANCPVRTRAVNPPAGNANGFPAEHLGRPRGGGRSGREGEGAVYSTRPREHTSARLEEEDGDLAQVKVYEALGLMRDVAAEVAADLRRRGDIQEAGKGELQRRGGEGR